MNKININKSVPFAGDFDAAVQVTTVALQEQGFGILTQIDVHSTLKKKLDVDYPRTLILGACNPKLAHQALLADPNVSVLMPCNVVVREIEGGNIEVSAMDPLIISDLLAHPDIIDVANEASKRIDAALEKISKR
jgi:uncharacterized protein (DUF302 family)